MNIVSFSGGKDSTAMLLMMIEKETPIEDMQKTMDACEKLIKEMRDAEG